MNEATIVAMFFLTLVAFTVRVVTGFGSAILLSPIFSNLMPPKEAVVLIILLESFVNVIFLLKERMNFSLREIYLGAFFGIAAGILFFGLLPQEIVGLTIGVGMGIMAGVMLLGVDFKVRRTRPLFLSMGFLSGAMGVITGVNGPQIVITLANQGYAASFIRSFMITYLVVIDTATLSAFFAFGHVNAQILTNFLVLAPSIVIAYALGSRILSRMDGERLRRIILSSVVLLSLVVILRYGGGLIG
jgi:uncharacterized membrane protein YfcA